MALCVAVVLCVAALPAATARPRLQLTPLGATLTAAQRSQLKAAAQRVIAGGVNRWPSYTKPGTLANYYTPDDHTDPRRHYGSQYVRDFTYTFTMASDVPVLANGSDIPNILDYLMSGQDGVTGELPEGGMPPASPAQNCWDNGPFLAKAVASYALLYDDLSYLCGVHRQDNSSRVSKLLRGLEFLDVPLQQGEPHLVTSPGTHCMYGFTDGERKVGHVLYTSLLLVEAAQLMADALVSAARHNVRGCEASLKLEQPFLALAAAINDTIASNTSPLEDHTFGSGLMLATDAVGHNSLPDVWGSGLAVQIGAGTDAQRARIQAALAANASRIFRWGQARHLIWPMCWEEATPYPGFMNQNQCTETGGRPGSIEHSWCNGKPCGFYQNGGYWSTPLGWMLPAVARANFSLAANILQAALNDSFTHGFNEAVNHEAHYNPPQKYPPQTYQGVRGYLASVASIYGTVWSIRRGAAPSPPLPASSHHEVPPSGKCVSCQPACATAPALASGQNLCSNITGRWTGTWTGSYIYNVLESDHHEVTFCSVLKRDCWSTATGLRHDRYVELAFHRCQPFTNVSKAFKIDPTCTTLTTTDGKYTRLKCDEVGIFADVAVAPMNPSTTAAHEQYLQKYLPGLAEYRDSTIGKLLIAIADLVDVVPTWLEDLLVPLVLPGSSLTIPLNLTVPLELPAGHGGKIPLPGNITLLSVSFDDLDEIKALRPGALLPGGNFTWGGVAALRQTTVSVQALVSVLDRPVNIDATVLLHSPTLQFTVIAAFNRSKLCEAWGAVMRSSISCALWPLFLRTGTAGTAHRTWSGLNITSLLLNISDFNATLNVSGLNTPALNKLLSTELTSLIDEVKPQLLNLLTSISPALASSATTALTRQLPRLQAECQPLLRSTITSLEASDSPSPLTVASNFWTASVQLLNASRVCVSNNGAFLLRYQLSDCPTDLTGPQSRAFPVDQSTCVEVGAGLPGVHTGDILRVRAQVVAGVHVLTEPALRYVPSSNAVSFECSGTTLKYGCTLVSVTPVNPGVMPQASTLCVINHAGFVASYKVKNARTGASRDSGHFPIDQTRCVNLATGVGGKSRVGDAFATRVSAVLGKAEEVNREVQFAPNNLTATFECKGTTLNFHCDLLGTR